MKKFKPAFEIVAKVYLGIFTWMLLLGIVAGSYVLGFLNGQYQGQLEVKSAYQSYVSSMVNKIADAMHPSVTPVQTLGTDVNQMFTPVPIMKWGGPDLWEEVNKRRIELGVNPLNQKDNLCTIASIRLNEQLELGKLDAHEGFTTMTERRPDLAYIFEDYSTVAEFLATGGETAKETVSLWENSLGHKKIVTGGEYVWGCIYAQDTFAVAIAAF